MATVKGGEKVREMLEQMADKITNASTLQVGFLEGSTEPDGTPTPMVAAIQEYGAPKAGIPPRPFFRNMIAAHESEWPAAIADLIKDNNYDMHAAFVVAGQAIAGQLQQSIIETNSPPLAASTLRKRGVGGMVYNPKDQSTFGAKPLIDTGTMYNNVSFAVKKA